MSQIKKLIPIESLSYNARRSLKKGALVGSITIIIYLLVVILTTPNLSPVNATFAALKTNSIIIIGLGIGIGVQIFISSYGKSLGCEINRSISNNSRNDGNRRGIGRFHILTKGRRLLGSGDSTTSGTTAALSSFFSFFSLVPLGCCGSWLLILSVLPSLFGTTASIALIEYSKMLSYLSLMIVFGFAFLSAYKLKKRMRLIDDKSS